jgi:ribosomal protein S18 acetylase RimI-like enzyme
VTGLVLTDLAAKDIRGAAAVLGRGMRDNPLHIRALGPDPDTRERALTALFTRYLAQIITKGFIIGAFSSGTLVGVCAAVEPGRCKPTPSEKLRLLPGLLRTGSASATMRVLKWTARWAAHDPKVAHWHLGPVGVDRHLQGRGIGNAMLEEFCRRIVRFDAVSYLETDKRENVTFYQRFGFQVTTEDAVLDTPNWFMTRNRTSAASGRS